jgi:hypothetical protein
MSCGPQACKPLIGKELQELMELLACMNMPQWLAYLTRKSIREHSYDKKFTTVHKEVAKRCCLFLLHVVNSQIIELLLFNALCCLPGYISDVVRWYAY